MDKMNKSELGELLDQLSDKVDSGRHTGADVQRLRVATKIYIERFETEEIKKEEKKHFISRVIKQVERFNTINKEDHAKLIEILKSVIDKS